MRRFIAVMAVSLAIALTSLAMPGDSNGEEQKGKGAGGGDQLKGRIVAIATHPMGSLAHTIGSILCNIISKYTPMRAEVEPTGGPKAWLPLMAKGDFDFGLASDLDVLAAIRGDSRYYKGSFKMLRVVKQGRNALTSSMVVRADSGIKSLQDLTGKRIAGMAPGQPSLEEMTRASIYSANVNLEGIKMLVAENFNTAVRAVKEGRADSAVSPLGAPVVEELQAAWGARFLSSDITDEGLKRARKYLPTAEGVEVMPGPTGVKEKTGFLAYSYNLVASRDLSEAVIREVLKALDQHFEEYKDSHPAMKTWAPNKALGPLIPAPVHESAISYYKKAGIWTQGIELRHQELMSLVGDKK